MAKVFAFLRNMDGEDKAKVLKVTGIVVALFTLFTLMSTVSYLFTWKADQSILATSVGDTSVKAANYGSNMGFRLADFLVRKCFGLGSLALCVFLFAVSARLLAGRWRRSLSKTLFLSLFGALLASFIFAYVSRLGSWENVFGGGLGGECGRTAVHWLVTMFGDIITALLLLALAALFLYMTSTKFARWFDSLNRSPNRSPSRYPNPLPPGSLLPRQARTRLLPGASLRSLRMVARPSQRLPRLAEVSKGWPERISVRMSNGSSRG